VTGSARSAPQEGSEIGSLLQQGITHVLATEHEQALACFERVIESDPIAPIGYFFKAEAFYWRYLYTDEEEDGERFRTLSELTITTAKARLQRHPHELQSRLYLGRAMANLARYHAANEHYLKAYWISRKGEKVITALLREDPRCYDAYLELGLYHYFLDVAKILRLVSVLFNLDGDRALGISELELAAAHGRYAAAQARYFLQACLLYFEEDFERARLNSQQLVEQYPTNPLFRLDHAGALQELGRLDEAREQYQQVLSLPHSALFPDLVLDARYQIGRVLMTGNDFAAAAETFAALIPAARKHQHWAAGWAQLQLGRCQEIAGQRERALAEYRAVVKLDDADARKAARRAIATPLERVDVELITASNLIKQRRYDQARARLRSLEDATEKHQEGYPASHRAKERYLLGRCAQEQDRLEEAILAYRETLALPADEEWVHPWAHYRLACCLQELGEHARAQHHLDKADNLKDERLRALVAKQRQVSG